MISPKQWKQFNNYRDKLHKQVIESDEYKESLRQSYELFEPIKKEVKVLRGPFWNRRIETEVREYERDWVWTSLRLDILSFNRELLLAKVPPKTVEACLDYLCANPKDSLT